MTGIILSEKEIEFIKKLSPEQLAKIGSLIIAGMFINSLKKSLIEMRKEIMISEMAKEYNKKFNP